MKTFLPLLVLLTFLTACSSTSVNSYAQRQPNYRTPTSSDIQSVVLKSCSENPFSVKESKSWNISSNFYICTLSRVGDNSDENSFTADIMYSQLEVIVSESKHKVAPGIGVLGATVPVITFTPAVKIDGHSDFSGEDFLDYKIFQIFNNGKYKEPTLSDFINRSAESIAAGFCPKSFNWTKKDTAKVARDAFENKAETLSAIQNQLISIARQNEMQAVTLLEFKPEYGWVKGPAYYFNVSAGGHIKQLMFGPYSEPFSCK